jgi:hypothetical protein
MSSPTKTFKDRYYANRSSLLPAANTNPSAFPTATTKPSPSVLYPTTNHTTTLSGISTLTSPNSRIGSSLKMHSLISAPTPTEKNSDTATSPTQNISFLKVSRCSWQFLHQETALQKTLEARLSKLQDQSERAATSATHGSIAQSEAKTDTELVDPQHDAQCCSSRLQACPTPQAPASDSLFHRSASTGGVINSNTWQGESHLTTPTPPRASPPPLPNSAPPSPCPSLHSHHRSHSPITSTATGSPPVACSADGSSSTMLGSQESRQTHLEPNISVTHKPTCPETHYLPKCPGPHHVERLVRVIEDAREKRSDASGKQDQCCIEGDDVRGAHAVVCDGWQCGADVGLEDRSANEAMNGTNEAADGPHEASEGPANEVLNGHSKASEGPNKAPKETNKAPEKFNEGPEGSNEGPTRPSEGPKGPNEGPTGSNEGLKGPNEEPKGPNEEPKGPKEGPRGPNEGCHSDDSLPQRRQPALPQKWSIPLPSHFPSAIKQTLRQHYLHIDCRTHLHHMCVLWDLRLANPKYKLRRSLSTNTHQTETASNDATPAEKLLPQARAAPCGKLDKSIDRRIEQTGPSPERRVDRGDAGDDTFKENFIEFDALLETWTKGDSPAEGGKSADWRGQGGGRGADWRGGHEESLRRRSDGLTAQVERGSRLVSQLQHFFQVIMFITLMQGLSFTCNNTLPSNLRCHASSHLCHAI